MPTKKPASTPAVPATELDALLLALAVHLKATAKDYATPHRTALGKAYDAYVGRNAKHLGESIGEYIENRAKASPEFAAAHDAAFDAIQGKRKAAAKRKGPRR